MPLVVVPVRKEFVIFRMPKLKFFCRSDILFLSPTQHCPSNKNLKCMFRYIFSFAIRLFCILFADAGTVLHYCDADM